MISAFDITVSCLSLAVVQRINIKWLPWLGPVVRMEEDTPMTFRYPLEGPNRGSLVIDWLTKLLGAQEAEAPEIMCCGKPKFVKRIFMLNKVFLEAYFLASN